MIDVAFTVLILSFSVLIFGAAIGLVLIALKEFRE